MAERIVSAIRKSHARIHQFDIVVADLILELCGGVSVIREKDIDHVHMRGPVGCDENISFLKSYHLLAVFVMRRIAILIFLLVIIIVSEIGIYLVLAYPGLEIVYGLIPRRIGVKIVMNGIERTVLAGIIIRGMQKIIASQVMSPHIRYRSGRALVSDGFLQTLQDLYGDPVVIIGSLLSSPKLIAVMIILASALPLRIPVTFIFSDPMKLPHYTENRIRNMLPA